MSRTYAIISEMITVYFVNTIFLKNISSAL